MRQWLEAGPPFDASVEVTLFYGGRPDLSTRYLSIQSLWSNPQRDAFMEPCILSSPGSLGSLGVRVCNEGGGEASGSNESMALMESDRVGEGDKNMEEVGGQNWGSDEEEMREEEEDEANGKGMSGAEAQDDWSEAAELLNWK